MYDGIRVNQLLRSSMSILLTSEEGWIISHLQYLDEIYKKVLNESRFCALIFNKMIFEINSQYLRQNQIPQTVQDDAVSHSKKKRKRSQLLPERDLEEVGLKKKKLVFILYRFLL